MGGGPRLQPQVEARLKGTKQAAAYASDAPDTSTSWEPLDPVNSWQIVRVQTENALPLWASVLDDDPVYALTVDLEVEYANGRQARLQWKTWRYGLVFGPLVVSYGDGPPGESSRLPDVKMP